MVRSRSGQLRNTSRRGHTMVELLIVVVLIAVVAGMAFPRVSFVDLRLDGNVRVVRSVLQQAWRLSIQKQHDVLVSVDVANYSIRVLEDLDNDGLPTPGERITWRPLEEGVRFDTPPSGVHGTVSGEVVGAGVRTVTSFPTVIFRRNGSTSGDVEIYLSAQKRGSRGWRAVTVAQTTGRTEWFRRVNNAWKSGGL